MLNEKRAKSTKPKREKYYISSKSINFILSTKPINNILERNWSNPKIVVITNTSKIIKNIETK